MRHSLPTILSRRIKQSKQHGTPMHPPMSCICVNATVNCKNADLVRDIAWHWDKDNFSCKKTFLETKSGHRWHSRQRVNLII